MTCMPCWLYLWCLGIIINKRFIWNSSLNVHMSTLVWFLLLGPNNKKRASWCTRFLSFLGLGRVRYAQRYPRVQRDCSVFKPAIPMSQQSNISNVPRPAIWGLDNASHLFVGISNEKCSSKSAFWELTMMSSSHTAFFFHGQYLRNFTSL